MAITIKDVDYIAALARLEFTAEEKEQFAHQLTDILHYMEKLNELDTTNVEPLSHVIELSNVFRDDVVKPSIPTADALRNAPAKTDSHFKVPKVIG